MARQKGIIKIKGTIGDLSFYETQDGHLARQKGGIDGNRIKTDAAFQRTRENGQEFAESARSSKLLRDAIRPYLHKTADNRVVSRLTRVMSIIKNLDLISDRGLRTVGEGLNSAAGKEALNGFSFNVNTSLKSVMAKPAEVNSSTGAVIVKNLAPETDITSPEGATHIVFSGCWLRIDFLTGATEVNELSSVEVPINNPSANLLLTPAALPTGTGTDIFIFKVAFFQSVNGKKYSLKNGTYTVLDIVAVF